MSIEKRIQQIEKRLNKLEAHDSHTPERAANTKHPDDAVIRRERYETSPKFSSKELAEHVRLHKLDKLPPHNHKPSTSKQFHVWRFGTPEQQAEKKRRENARIAAERAAIANEQAEFEDFKFVLKNHPPTKVSVQHVRGKYAWLTWEPPRPQENYELAGYYIYTQNGQWPMRKVNCRRRELLRSWHIGSGKVRVGALYKWKKNREGTSWSCYKYRRQ